MHRQRDYSQGGYFSATDSWYLIIDSSFFFYSIANRYHIMATSIPMAGVAAGGDSNLRLDQTCVALSGRALSLQELFQTAAHLDANVRANYSN